jgi:hypothetical protein
MLQIDEEALDAFRELGSIRIAGVEADGVRIFLNRVAATALDDQVIGVEAHDDHFHFTFEDQPG